MEEKLKEIFGYVNSWLNHAEAKNGAIIVLNGACVIGLLTLLLGTDYNIHYLIRIYFIVALGLLLISTGISLYSFFPMTGKFETDGEKNDHQNAILMFYGDIAKCRNSRKYVLSIYKEYFNDTSKTEEDITKSEEDYAKEIIYNSIITVRKYTCFKISLMLTISAFVSLPILGIVCAIINVYKAINTVP
ncbi:MAG: Pycsar system effector family protein [Bacillota bacterium]|jgi:hypothetical protein